MPVQKEKRDYKSEYLLRKKQKAQLSIFLPYDLKERLAQIALLQGQSSASIIRKLIEDYVEEAENEIFSKHR